MSEDDFFSWVKAHKASILRGMSVEEQAAFNLRFRDLQVLAKQLSAPEGVEIQRLTACLHTANDQAEHYEREYYLAADARDDAQALLAKATVFRISDEITVEKRGEDSWCVSFGGNTVLNTLGEREYEPSPSNRDEDFIARARFTFREAMWRAEVRAVADRAEHQRRMKIYRRKKALNRLPWQKRGQAKTSAAI